MKKLLIVLFYGISLSCQDAELTANTPVILRGGSCTGKTSIMRALEQRGWQTISEDTVYLQKIAGEWEKRYPDEFLAIKDAIDDVNIFHALTRDQILFKKDATEEQRAHAIQAIAVLHDIFRKSNEKDAQHRQQLLQKGVWKSIRALAISLYNKVTFKNYVKPQTIEEYDEEQSQRLRKWWHALSNDVAGALEEGLREKNVIVDSWFMDHEVWKDLKERHGAITILVYTSFPEIVRRNLERNYRALTGEHGSIEEVRFFNIPLYSFKEYFELVTESEGAIDSLSKADFVRAMDIVTLCLHDRADVKSERLKQFRREMDKQEFEAYCQPILELFKEQDPLYVRPQPYLLFDHVIRTDVCSSEDVAQQIVELTAKVVSDDE